MLLLEAASRADVKVTTGYGAAVSHFTLKIPTPPGKGAAPDSSPAGASGSANARHSRPCKQ